MFKRNSPCRSVVLGVFDFLTFIRVFEEEKAIVSNDGLSAKERQRGITGQLASSTLIAFDRHDDKNAKTLLAVSFFLFRRRSKPV